MDEHFSHGGLAGAGEAEEPKDMRGSGEHGGRWRAWRASLSRKFKLKGRQPAVDGCGEAARLAVDGERWAPATNIAQHSTGRFSMFSLAEVVQHLLHGDD